MKKLCEICMFREKNCTYHPNPVDNTCLAFRYIEGKTVDDVIGVEP